MVRNLYLLVSRSIVVVIAMVVLSSNASAQTWTKIGTFQKKIRCEYFWDTAHGVIAGDSCIYCYNAGTWTTPSYPEAPGVFKALRLLDPTHLYAASGSSDVWVSTDQGATWSVSGLHIANADDIYQTPSGTIVGVNIGGTGMMRGTTFARIDPLHCILSQDDQKSPLYSTDGGVTWDTSKAPSLGPGGYTCTADPCRGLFYAVTDGLKFIIMKSADYGKTWSQGGDLGEKGSDVIDGGLGGILYGTGLNGVYRFQQLFGQPIGGPVSSTSDHRIFAFGLYSRYLIVPGDTSVWRWDGGPSSPIPVWQQFGQRSVNITACDSTLHLILDARSQDGVVHLTASTVGTIKIYPADTTITQNGSSTIELNYRLSQLSPLKKTTFHLHASGIYPCGSVTWDSVFDYAMGSDMVTVTAGLVHISACDSTNVPIIITQTKCNSLVLIPPYVEGDPLDHLKILSIPKHGLAQGETDTIWLQYSPRGISENRSYKILIDGTFQPTGVSFDTALQLSVQTAVAGVPEFSATVSSPVPVCSRARIPIVLNVSGCGEPFLWDSLAVQNGNGLVVRESSHSDTVQPGQTDTVWLDVTSMPPGNFQFSVHCFAHGLRTNLTFDTTASLSLTSSNVDIGIVNDSSVSASNCVGSRFPIIVHDPICDSLVVSSFSVHADSIVCGATTACPLTIHSGSEDTLWVSIPSQSAAGDFVMDVHIFGMFGGSTVTFDSAFGIKVHLERSAPQLLAQKDTIVLPFCSSVDTTLVFTNRSCDAIVVTGDSTKWTAGFSSGTISYPFTLLPDSSFTVSIRYVPQGISRSDQRIAYTFHGLGQDSSQSSGLWIEAISQQGYGAVALSTTSLDAGQFSICGADTIVRLQIINSQCDSIRVAGLHLTGDASFQMISTGQDTSLAVGEVEIVEVRFTPQGKGTHSALLSVHSTDMLGGGNGHDTSVALFGIGLSGVKRAEASAHSIDFGSTSICEERDSLVTITNTGCDTVTISRAEIPGPDFFLADTLRYPIILPPNTQALFPIVTGFDTTGHPTSISGTLFFISDADTSIPSVTLTRSVNYPGHFSLVLTAEDSARPNQRITALLTRTGLIPSAIAQLDFDLVYDGDLLTFDSVDETDIHPGLLKQLANNVVDQPFVLKPVTDRATLATIHFRSSLAQNDTTAIGIANTQFTTGVNQPASCVASFDTAGSRMYLTLLCGEDFLTRVLNDQAISIQSLQITPDVLQLAIKSMLPGTGRIEILDVLGRGTILHDFSCGPGKIDMTMNIHDLPPGAYFLRLIEGPSLLTRRFVVVR